MKEQTSKTSTKKVVVNSIIYSVSGLLLKCFSFFLLPLYTAYLTTEDYGITSIAMSFINTMSFIVALSLYSAVMRFYVDLKNDPEKLKRFYGTVSVFTFLSGIVWLGVFTIFRTPLSELVFSGVPFFPIILVAIIELIFVCQVTIFDDILKSQQRAMASSVISIVSFFVKLGLNIYFIVILEMGALGSLIATTIVEVLYSLIFLGYLLKTRQIKLCFDTGLLKSALKYSIPIIPHNLSTRIALLISKVLIGGTASLGSLGIYSVASQFGEVSDTLQTYVDKAYQPWLYEKLHANETDFKDSIRSTVRMLIAVLGLLFICISLFAQDYVVLFVNKGYVDAWKYIPLIILVFAIKTAYYFYIEVLFYNKKASKLIFISTLTGSIINVLLSAFMIPAYGVYGSIAADAIAMIIRVGIVIFISKRFEDVGLRIWDFVLNFLIIAAFIFGGLFLSYIKYGDTFSFINLGYKILVVAAYIALILILYKKQLKAFIKSIRSRRSSGN